MYHLCWSLSGTLPGHALLPCVIEVLQPQVLRLTTFIFFSQPQPLYPSVPADPRWSGCQRGSKHKPGSESGQLQVWLAPHPGLQHKGELSSIALASSVFIAKAMAAQFCRFQALGVVSPTSTPSGSALLFCPGEARGQSEVLCLVRGKDSFVTL